MKLAVFRHARLGVIAVIWICTSAQLEAQSCKCHKNPGPGGGVQCARDQIATCDASSGECNCTCDSVPRGKSKEEYESEIFSKVLGSKVEPGEIFSQRYKGLVSSFAEDSEEKGTFHFDRDLGNGRKAKITVGVPEFVEEVLKKGVSGPGASLQNCPNGNCASSSSIIQRENTNINQGSGSIAQVGGARNTATVNNFGPQPQISNENIAKLAHQLALCSSGPTIAVPNVENPTLMTQRDGQNVVSAFAQTHTWQFNGLGQTIHGQDIGPDGPIPDPTGIHIYSDAKHKILAECVKAAFTSIGANVVVGDRENQGDSLGILIGNAPE